MSVARRGATTLALALVVSCGGDTGRDILVSRAVAPAPANVGSADSATMAVYATLENRGAAADTLTGVETTAARTATLHSTMDHGGGMKMMMPVAAVVIAAQATARLVPGGAHIMLEGLTKQFAAGDSVGLVLVFRRAGRIPATASVVGYDQLERALTP